MKNRYITVYHVTRHYGGPEEGGWWYNWNKPVETGKIPKKFQGNTSRARNKVDQMVAKLKQDHEHEEWGNIYHMSDGLMVSVFTETNRREFETKVRPHYE